MTLPAGIKFHAGLPRLIHSVSRSRTGKRTIATISYADPFWQAEMETLPLAWADKMLMRAFEAEYGSGMKTVRYVVPGRVAVPQAYWSDPANVIPANNGNLVSVASGSTLLVDSITAGLDLRRGDLISLATGEYRSLHMIKADVVAASGSVTLSVEPFVPGHIATGAVVKFVNPEMNTRIVEGSFKIDDEFVSPVSFSLVSVAL